jgi:hypothetical protein
VWLAFRQFQRAIGAAFVVFWLIKSPSFLQKSADYCATGRNSAQKRGLGHREVLRRPSNYERIFTFDLVAD